MSQLQLAEKLGINQGNVSQWVNARSLPTGLTIDMLCQLLNVPITEFFRIDDTFPSMIPKPNLDDVAATVLKSLGFEPPKRLKKKKK